MKEEDMHAVKKGNLAKLLYKAKQKNALTLPL